MRVYEQERQHKLLMALLQDKYFTLYQSSAEFNLRMQELVRTLPMWVEFLAQSATQNEEATQQTLKSLQTFRDAQFLG
jgi:hypothetical protein